MVVALAGCVASRAHAPMAAVEWSSPYLFVWTTDADSVDLNFLAVLDAREDAAGTVVTTPAIPT